jgi:hypothetical protein
MVLLLNALFAEWSERDAKRAREYTRLSLEACLLALSNNISFTRTQLNDLKKIRDSYLEEETKPPEQLMFILEKFGITSTTNISSK